MVLVIEVTIGENDDVVGLDVALEVGKRPNIRRRMKMLLVLLEENDVSDVVGTHSVMLEEELGRDARLNERTRGWMRRRTRRRIFVSRGWHRGTFGRVGGLVIVTSKCFIGEGLLAKLLVETAAFVLEPAAKDLVHDDVTRVDASMVRIAVSRVELFPNVIFESDVTIGRVGLGVEKRRRRMMLDVGVMLFVGRAMTGMTMRGKRKIRKRRRKGMCRHLGHGMSCSCSKMMSRRRFRLPRAASRGRRTLVKTRMLRNIFGIAGDARKIERRFRKVGNIGHAIGLGFEGPRMRTRG